MSSTLRLNLGCGLNAPQEWVNVDRSPSLMLDRLPFARTIGRRAGMLSEAHMVRWPSNIRRLDVTRRLPFPDEGIEVVYSSHMLEHLFWSEANALLRECWRLLERGGILRVALPDGEAIARKLLAGGGSQEAALNYARDLAMAPLESPSVRHRVVGRFASSPHRWQPTSGLVVWMFDEAGFGGSHAATYRSSRIREVSAVEHRPESLFVEGIKP